MFLNILVELMSIYRIALTTVAKKKDGERIAALLVKKRVVACVNLIGPITSFFTWKRKNCRESEFLLIMKTESKKIKDLERQLLQMHPYEVPEFVVIPIEQGSKSYLRWISTSIKPARFEL